MTQLDLFEDGLLADVTELIGYPPDIQAVIDRFVHYPGLHRYERIICEECGAHAPDTPHRRWCTPCSATQRSATYYENQKTERATA